MERFMPIQLDPGYLGFRKELQLSTTFDERHYIEWLNTRYPQMKAVYTALGEPSEDRHPDLFQSWLRMQYLIYHVEAQ